MEMRMRITQYSLNQKPTDAMSDSKKEGILKYSKTDMRTFEVENSLSTNLYFSLHTI